MTSVASIATGRHLRRAKGNVELHESGKKSAQIDLRRVQRAQQLRSEQLVDGADVLLVERVAPRVQREGERRLQRLRLVCRSPIVETGNTPRAGARSGRRCVDASRSSGRWRPAGLRSRGETRECAARSRETSGQQADRGERRGVSADGACC